MKLLDIEQKKTPSYITRGSVVLLECESIERGLRLVYRLSVEPRPRLRPEDHGLRSYTVTVEKLYNGRRTTSCLRDFTADRAVAEEVYRLVTRRGVLPEHLSDFYEDYTG